MNETKYTGRLSIPYPSSGHNNWFSIFETMIGQIDTALFADIEDRNLFITGGGEISFDAGTGVLEWSDDISIVSPSTGVEFLLDAGTVTLSDGQMAVFSAVRGGNTGSSLPVTAVSQITVDESVTVLAIRYGDKVYLRNGSVVADGASVLAIEKPVEHDEEFTISMMLPQPVLSTAPREGIPAVFVDGLLVSRSLYTITGVNVTFAPALSNGQVVRVRFLA